MKRIFCFFLIMILLAGCGAEPAADGGVTFTDDLGYPVTLTGWERVVSLYGSFGETWLLAGGSLTGTTRDALTERGLSLGEDVAVVGTVKGAAAGNQSRRGKSGHHKAACPVKAGDTRSQCRVAGKCHRKQTARKGKGEKVG